MFTRVLSTLVLWSVILASLWFFGAHAAVVLLTLLSALSLHEFYGLMDRMNLKPFRWLGLAIGVVMTAAPYYLTVYLFDGKEFGGFAPAVLAVAVVICGVRILGERDTTNRFEAFSSTLLGLIYLPFMLHYMGRILLIHEEPVIGLMLCLWLVATSKFCDVGALLTGLAIGRHKLAPNISPKKSWEGAVGGVLVSVGVGAGIAYLAADWLPESFTPAIAALVALPIAVTTIVSDLVESAIKRRADIKDTGTVIPGIGGALDLTDSLILTAPMGYFIFFFLS
ncbi:MAG: phosphatidate cytidylyltransferase [Opitutaceae bacterium]|nr:phosphatidate cytidylyltransferase [Opitutaceae bacterium]